MTRYRDVSIGGISMKSQPSLPQNFLPFHALFFSLGVAEERAFLQHTPVRSLLRPERKKYFPNIQTVREKLYNKGGCRKTLQT
jgi:hypothetical protein